MVDRFASLNSSQLPQDNSLYQDPLTEGVDPLTQSNWGQHNSWENAPFWLISRILEMVVRQGARATVIVPWWPSQP